MLKIKDNVNLNVLEKFGFVLTDVAYEFKLINRDSYAENYDVCIIVYNTNFRNYKARELYLFVDDVPTDELYLLDVLYDLIKADLVEVVK